MGIASAVTIVGSGSFTGARIAGQPFGPCGGSAPEPPEYFGKEEAVGRTGALIS